MPATPHDSVDHAERTLALARVYRAERALVRRHLRGFGVRDGALEDALHDVFVVAFRRLSSYDGQRAPLRAWLVGIAWRVAAAHRRVRTDSPALRDDEVASDMPDPEAYVARSEAAAVLDRLLRALPPEQAAALVLAELEGLSGSEIAEAWHIAPATAYTRVARARLKLQAELERHRYGRRAWWSVLVWRGGETNGTVLTAAFVSMRVLVGIVAAIVVLGGVAWWIARADATPTAAQPDPSAAVGSTRVRERVGPRVEAVDAFGHNARAASISGRVHTTSGAPIERAEVCVWPEISEHGGTVPRCSTTVANGSYRIAAIPPSRYRVTASAPGYAPGESTIATARGASSLTLHAGEARSDVDIALAKGGIALRGTVSDVFGGPVDGARVTLRDHVLPGHIGGPSWGTGIPVRVTTGADGTFQAWVSARWLDVDVRAEGYGDAVVEAFAPGPTVAIALLPESSLSGIVIEKETRVPVAGARVVLRESDELAQHEATVAFTDESGRFSIRGLVAGRYRPAAIAEGRQGESARSHVLDLGDAIDDVVIEMIAATSFRATIVVTPDETPCPSGSVMLWDRGGHVTRTAAIAPDGVAAFAALTDGEYGVVVACDEHDSAAAPKSVTVGGDAPTEVTWHVTRGRAIRGRVLDHAGRPLEGQVVASAASMGPDGSYRWTRIGPDGAYTLSGLAPGDYSLNADTKIPGIAATATIVDRDVGLDLVGKATVRVSGRVTRGDAPASSVLVTEHAVGGYGASTVPTNDDGTFTFEALPTGNRRIVAEDELGNRSVEHAIALVADRVPAEIVLALPEPRAIRGVVLDEDGGPLRDALVSALSTDAQPTEAARRSQLRAKKAGGRGTVLTDADGEFVLTGVSDDRTYTVVAQRRGGGSASKEGVRAGDHTRLQLAATATISGNVTAATGPTALWVELFAEGGLVQRESFMLGSGRFELADLDAGAYEVRAIAREGRGRASVVARAGETTNVEIPLVPYRTIRGRFVELESGAPLPNLWASITEEGATPLRVAMEAERVIQSRADGQLSDADGNFVIQNVPPTTALLLVLSVGFQFDAPDHVHEALLVPETVPSHEVFEIAIPRPRAAPSEMMTDLGFAFHQWPLACGETMRIDAITDPALENVLHVGDEVVAVDGHDVSGYRCYLVKTLLTLKPGEHAELTLGTGAKVEVTAPAPK